MGKLCLHHVPVFEFQPSGISRIAVDETSGKVAVAKIGDASSLIEIWNSVNEDHWFHEQTLLPMKSVEALLWCDGRLFSAGLHSDIVEHDLHTGGVKSSDSAMSGGAIWCMTLNKSQKLIAAGTEASSVMLFEIFEGVRFSRSFVKHEGRITAIAWYDPLNVIVTGGVDNVRVWSVNSGNPLQRILIAPQHKNKETIVWAVAAFGSGDQLTIVSGDSTGKTCFWEGPPEQYTSSKCLQSHQSDVRAITVGRNGEAVYSSGVDPALVRFELATVGPGGGGRQWVMAKVRKQHLNDVNTLACLNESVISAGLDCKIIINDFVRRKTVTISPIPQKQLVHLAHDAHSLLVQYPMRLELWRLADTDETNEVNGTILSMSSPKKLLLKLTAKDDQILSSLVSRCGKWLVYADCRAVHLYSFAMDDVESGRADLLTPVPISDRPRESAFCFAFSQDSKHLVCAMRSGCLWLVKLREPQSSASKRRILPQDEFGPVYLMSISASGTYLAIAELLHGIHIFSMKKLKLITTLPKTSSQPAAISFHPQSDLLLISYSDRKILEYDVGNRGATRWSNKFQSLRSDWSKCPNVVRRIFYCPVQPEIIFVQDDEYFVVIDKRTPMPQKPIRLFQRPLEPKDTPEKQKRGAKRLPFHISQNKYLIHLDFVKGNALVAVERLPADLVESLPPPFKQHKFGV